MPNPFIILPAVAIVGILAVIVACLIDVARG